MNRRNIFNLTALAALGLAVLPSSAFAKQNRFERRLVGTWALVSTTNTNSSGVKTEFFGPHPVGAYMFDASGHFTQVITPGEEGAAKDIVASYGTYSTAANGKTLVVNFIATNPPSFIGKDSKRAIVSLTNSELKIRNLATTSRAGTATSVWKRVR